jgi:Ni/Co efflux regulator RcnB
MRKVLISLLLAGAVTTPALAAPQRSSDRDSARQERQQAREDRQQAREERQSAREERSERSANVERPQVQAPERADRGGDARANFTAPARVQAVGRADARDVEALRSARQQAREDRRDNYVAPGPRAVSPRNIDTLRERSADLRDERMQERELRQSARRTPPVMQTRPPVVSNTPAPGTQPPPRAKHRRDRDHHWDTSWRHNSRYDWYNYRHRHRSLFHLGFYVDPYGWGYQPFSIGWRLWPSYYSSRYWINDPWMYRLPYPPPGYVWVRYWNDALLVDTWSGTVVDVIPGFFW